jgi:ligand-binding sensor domain-containing protein/signal transduction histidine kinase
MGIEHRRGRHIVAVCIVAAAMVLVVCPRGWALDPALDVSQYAHTAWKIRDGFTKGGIFAITQTPDGYLWLGTEFGLLRFDGVRVVSWQPPAGLHLPSDYIVSLLVTRDGTLWIGTLKGLASLKDGRLTRYPELAGSFVNAIVEDHEGTVWASAGAVTGGKLCTIENGNVQCYEGDGTFGSVVFSLYEDSKGNLWAGVSGGLWRWRPGPPKFYPLARQPDGIQALGEDPDGTLLAGWKGGIYRFVDGRTEAYSVLGSAHQFRANRIFRDHDGGLWIGAQSLGLVHVHQGRSDMFSLSDGLSGDHVAALFQDREGDLWVATNGGLDRFRNFTVATFSVGQGLSQAVVSSVLADRDGSVWFADGAVQRWNNGKILTYGERDKRLSGRAPHSLFQDSRGRIWVCTVDRVGYLEKGGIVSVPGIPGMVRGLAEDSAGNLWIATLNSGLFRLSARGEVQQTAWTDLGRKDFPTALALDPLRGGLWIGFYEHGITYFGNGKVQASYGIANGLGEGVVSRFRFDADGTVWAATQGGLSRLKNGRVVTMTSKNGLPCDAVHWVIQDNDHSFWLFMPCGLVRIARSEVDAWAAAVDKDKDTKQTIRATVFDSSDGVRIRAYPGGGHSLVARSLDGKIWFATNDGVSVVDPHQLPINKIPPPVHIEQVTADRTVYDTTSDSAGAASGQLKLPALLRDMEIDYTALSLVVPEKVRFRYKLEGWDRDWQDAGNRREAFYSNLPPRHYRFRVAACNNSGVWNETGAALEFNISPSYYQTNWFLALCIASVLAILYLIYDLRLKQVARLVRGRMEERLGERERIARDLHDTFLQSVQGLILKFAAVAKQIPRDEPARRAMEDSLDLADQVLAEGRDRVRNLRGTAESLSDLPAAFRRVAEESPHGRMTFKAVVEGIARELHPLVLEESYSIGREALTNALTHSGGLHVETEITYDARQFRLRIRDDGRGIDSAILEKGGRDDHWGLQGMRERASRIGAQLEFWSRPGSGTEVELRVPAASAYQAGRVKKKRFWFRRSNGADGEPL